MTWSEVRTNGAVPLRSRALDNAHFAAFRRAVIDQFVPAVERQIAQPGAAWPKGLRVKRVQGAPGIWDRPRQPE